MKSEPSKSSQNKNKNEQMDDRRPNADGTNADFNVCSWLTLKAMPTMFAQRPKKTREHRMANK